MTDEEIASQGIDFIRADIGELESMLADMPADDVLGRVSLESRLERLQWVLQRMQSGELPARSLRNVLGWTSNGDPITGFGAPPDPVTMSYAQGQPLLKIRRLDKSLPMPAYQTAGASGIDLYASMPRSLLLGHYARERIRVGVALEIPKGFEGQVRPRSSLSAWGVIVALGTIDSDYRGELMVSVMNLSGGQYQVMPGDRIAQLVIVPVARASIVEVEELGETKRGSNGFGSTGK